MRAVDRVPGLEANDALPALLREDPARLGRIEVEVFELLRLRPIEHGDRTADISRWTLHQLCNARMLQLIGLEYLNGFMLLVD